MNNAPQDVFNPAWGVKNTLTDQQLTYPAADVIEQALALYQDAFRSPADVVYCIDGSGSMGDNGGWDGVRKASDLLFNVEQSRKYFLQVNPHDRTTALVFADGIKGGPWTVAGSDPSKISWLASQIKNASAGGGTDLFECLGRAADWYSATPSGGRKRLLILMTDGQANDSDDGRVARLASMNIPVIAVAFGDGVDTGTLQSISDATHGAFIKNDNLVQALRNATSYR